MMSRFLFCLMRNRIRLILHSMSAGEILVACRVNQTRHPFESLTRTNQLGSSKRVSSFSVQSSAFQSHHLRNLWMRSFRSGVIYSKISSTDDADYTDRNPER
jgi:hypothetical protein